MNKIKLNVLILIVAFNFIVYASEMKITAVDYVDTFIGTQDDSGQFFPGAYYPNGMVKLGPDTYPSSLTGDGDFAHSGYNYSDKFIRGFSHIRLATSGGGSISDRSGFVSVFPYLNSNDEISTGKRKIRFDKSTEVAHPGYYKVALDNGIKAELTVTAHCGFHKYTSPESGEFHILVDPSRRHMVKKSEIEIVGKDAFTGMVNGLGSQYFYGEFSKSFDRGIILGDDFEPLKGSSRIPSVSFGFTADKGEDIYLRIGFSTVSRQQARNNLRYELADWNFNQIVNDVKDNWNDKLSVVEVEGDFEYKELFYTHLYHSFHQPSVISDVDGQYVGLDKAIYTDKENKQYFNFAFWDSYRTKYPLISIVNPQLYWKITNSIINLYQQQSGYWHYADPEHKPHSCMFVFSGKNGFLPFMNCRNEHMMSMVLDSYKKGIYNQRQEQAYKGIVEEMLTQMPEKYEEIGYIPARPDQTCEYSYDNWCVAQMAKRLGKQDDYERFIKRSNSYKNTWDPSIGFFRAKAEDGTWLDFPESPALNREKYMYEGTPWQWRWTAIHDVDGLIELIGGKEKFASDLDYFFEEDLYNHGNQPDLHVPFLFNYAGEPWQTQKWVRKILTEKMLQRYGTHGFFRTPKFDRIYKATPDGFLEQMDDDYGCMSAWYVMSAMGLYQLCPGEPVYQLTAPIFESVSIKLDNDFYSGSRFTIKAVNLSAENIYIQSAALNGKVYNKSSITHQTISNGGELIFVMGNEPNKSWGVE
ncbi:MAG: GH92 family glycosyl hydrolase [Sedimentisphaeraceae bacterium JB056]